jgi:hypothetical protein
MVFWPLEPGQAARKRLRGAEVHEEPAAKAMRGVDGTRSSHVAAAYGSLSTCSPARSEDEEMPLAPQGAVLVYTVSDRWQQGCDFNYAI